MSSSDESVQDFIREIITNDLQNKKLPDGVITRFPPEPNGYLHIGHAKAICLNFELAKEYGGRCHLRFDDTNPETEETEYVESIKKDIRWLGFDWGNHEYYASDYFEQLYLYAEELIQKGLAYVCDLSSEEVRRTRGTISEPGKDSPGRLRSIDENLDLFRRMRAGEFNDGTYTVRAKIDMASPNFLFRDPPMYRIKKAHHHRTGDQWCIYPMYDFAHGQSDAIEHISHSICTLEFDVHRPLYEWFLKNLSVPANPKQIEFARLNISYTVLSKRKLLDLVEQNRVDGWEDPRMPTLSALRRRGVPPQSIRKFCERIGVAKRNGVVDVSLFEYYVREELNEKAARRMAVLKPLKVVIENYPAGQVEELKAPNHPQDASQGERIVPFSREIYIEQDDFMEDAPKKFFRLAPGREVRLRFAYFIKCNEVVKDPQTGDIIELRCTYDPQTKGGQAPDGRKVKGTIHWVSAQHAVPATVRLYDRLFLKENPLDHDENQTFFSNLNPNSLEVLSQCQLEPVLKDAQEGDGFQFERLGYFCIDSKESAPDQLVFNRTITLKDSWAKSQV